MGWSVGQRYRFRAVQGEAQIEKNPKTGTPSALVLLEVTAGPQLGQRLRFRGYLNSPANAEGTLAELRAMGWRGQKLGDWAGLGSKECEASCMADTGGDGKTYYRAAFVRALATVKVENAVKATDLDALNASLGDLLAKPSDPARLPPPPTPPSDNGTEEIPF